MLRLPGRWISASSRCRWAWMRGMREVVPSSVRRASAGWRANTALAHSSARVSLGGRVRMSASARSVSPEARYSAQLIWSTGTSIALSGTSLVASDRARMALLRAAPRSPPAIRMRARISCAHTASAEKSAGLGGRRARGREPARELEVPTLDPRDGLLDPRLAAKDEAVGHAHHGPQAAEDGLAQHVVREGPLRLSSQRPCHQFRLPGP